MYTELVDLKFPIVAEMFESDDDNNDAGILGAYQKKFQTEMLSYEFRVCQNCKA